MKLGELMKYYLPGRAEDSDLCLAGVSESLA